MIVRPGPGLRFAQRHPIGWPRSPVEPGLVGAVVPVRRDRSVAVISLAERLCLLTVDRDLAVVAESITGYVPAIATGDLIPIHPAARGAACTYLQSRRLIRYDLDARAHRVSPLLRGDDTGQHAIWVDAEEARLAVQVEDTSRYDDGGTVITRVDVFDVKAAPRRLGGRALPTVEAAGSGWAAGAGLVALAAAGGLLVFDADLQPLPAHPLATAARQALAEVGADRPHALRIHPSRPLAVLAACTAESGGMRTYETWRLAWPGGAPQVRPMAGFSAIDGLAFGAFAPEGEAVDVRASTCGAARLVLLDAEAEAIHDLGIARALQGAGWSVGPLRYLAFDGATGEILIWPGGRA